MPAYRTCVYYKNDGSGTTETQLSNEPYLYGYSAFDPTSDLSWTRDGYTFSIWNTSADGTGTDYAVHQSLPTTSNISLYAIWEQDAGPDIEITYKGSSIATMSASGTKTLETEGKYCEDDIVITYTKLSGSATTPATTITANPTISVSNSGLITASVSASQSVTPTVSAGYVSSGTAGTVSVSGSNTSQLTVYNGAHHQPTPAGYTVTVSLTNPVSPSDFISCEIYDAPTSDPEDVGNSIGSISTASGSTEVFVDSASYGIAVVPHGNWGNIYGTSDISCTGGVTLTSAEPATYGALFAITGDGTITIDGIDYGD